MARRGFVRFPAESTDRKDILVNFKGGTFAVQSFHRRGNCRPLTDFEKLCSLGEGSFGIVCKVRDKTTNNIFALKKLKIAKESELMPQNFLREITNLKLLKHENIVNLIEVVVGEEFHSTCLLLEYCKYSLADVIDDDPNHLQHPQIKNIMHQLFTGLNFIHKHCIFHRDINPANILFNEEGTLKITDFGSSRKFSKENVTPNIGTQWYRAPEILFGSVNYSSSVDIWSTGCIFAELLRQNVLFRSDSVFDIINLIINLLGSPSEAEWPEHSKLPLFQDYNLRQQRFNRLKSTFISETDVTVSLIREMLVYNPSMRLSAEKCLKHHYFKEPPEACSSKDLLSILQASETI